MVKESESARLNETRNHKQYNTTNNNNNNHLNIVNINVNNEAANLEDYFASLEDNNEDDDDGDDLNSSLMEREELQKKIRHLRYYWKNDLNCIYWDFDKLDSCSQFHQHFTYEFFVQNIVLASFL